MALQTSGPISLNDIHVEAGGTTGTLASINDADIRGLISKTAGTTMSFSEWYGASSLITLAAQSSNTTATTTSTNVTLPTSTTGDIAIATIMGSCSVQQFNGSITVNTPSGWTAVTSSQYYKEGPFTKGEYYMVYGVLVCYKVLSAGETSFTNGAVVGSQLSDVSYSTHVQVYRPGSAVSSVTANDVFTTSSNTLNCSAASSSVIMFGATIDERTVTHAWGSGPTYNAEIYDTTQYWGAKVRASSHFQSTASPSDVTWSSTTSDSSRVKYVSGYLEVS